MFDRIIAWSLRNLAAVVLLYAVLALAATAAWRHMPMDVFPEFAPPQVQIQTEAPGFSARDVEALVTRPIEYVLQGSPDVDQLRSNSTVGLARITVVFRWGVDIYRARQIIQERLRLVQGQLPESVGAIQLMPVTSAVSWLVKFGLIDWGGDYGGASLRSLVDWDFRNHLMALEGVASVVAVGGDVKQYQALVDPLRLRQYGLSFEDVVRAQRLSNAVAPGAFVYPSREEEYFVRADALVNRLSDLGSTLVAVRNGQPVRLRDVATVRFGAEVKRGDGQINGGPAVIATVSKLWGADTLETTRRVDAVLRQLAQNLPKDVELIPNVFRQATFIECSIGNLKQALIWSSAIVALVLALFLGRWRPTVISLIAIPASLLAAVLVLWLYGAGFNALTLGGLVFAIGEVVDDAIIDVENILRRLRENRQAVAPRPAIQVVYDGSREIRNSIVFATLVILVAFLPAFLLQGIEGRIFRPLAVAYLAATGSSLLVAITLVPVLCYCLIGRDAGQRQSYDVTPLARRGVAAYGRLLQGAVRHPRAVLCGMTVALAAALVLMAALGRSFLPPFNEGNLVIATTLLPGTSLEESLRVGREVERALGDVPQIALMAQRAGRSRLDEDAQPVNFSEYDVTLKPGTRDVPRVMQQIRERLARIPGMATNVSQFISHRMSEILSGVRAQVALKVFGSDFETLRRLQQQAQAAVKMVPGVVDLQSEPLIAVPGIDIRVNRDAAASFGFAPGQIVSDVGRALNGATVSRVMEDDRSFDVLVRIADDAHASVDSLGELPLVSAGGAVVPLRQVAAVEGVQAPFMINRDGGMRRAVVQWNVEGRDLNSVVTEARERVERSVRLPPGYSIEFGGDYEGQQRATARILASAAAALALVVVVMFQAFRRWPLVALVMVNAPFALIGGVFALAAAGETLNVSSMIGLIALFGIATRNGIILISRWQSLMAAGPADPLAVALNGARDRFVPILMTAFCAALAVVPLLAGDPAGKELERPLAIVLLGGMLSSTVLNLFVIPTFFLWMVRRGWLEQSPEELRLARGEDGSLSPL